MNDFKNLLLDRDKGAFAKNAAQHLGKSSSHAVDSDWDTPSKAIR